MGTEVGVVHKMAVKPVKPALVDILSSSSEHSPIIWHTPKWVMDGGTVSKWSEDTKRENEKQQSLLEQLSYSLTPTQNQFSAQFANIVEQVNDAVSKKKRSISKPDLPSPQFQLALVERVLLEDRYWPAEEISTLIKLQWIPYSHLAQLCALCIDKLDKDLVESFVLHCPHLPESVLVNIMKALLSCYGDEISDEHVKDMFLRLFSFKFNDSILVQELRSLDIKHCLVLLSFLYFLLFECNFVSKSPTFVQVVDWVCAVVDAQFLSLVMCPEAEKVVVSLRAIVCKQVALMDKLSVLDECLKQIAQQRSLPQEESAYVIETLNIQFS